MAVRTFSAREILTMHEWKPLPAVVIAGWSKGTKQDPLAEARRCRRRQNMRKAMGVVFFVACLLLVLLAVWLASELKRLDEIKGPANAALTGVGFLFVFSLTGALGAGALGSDFLRYESNMSSNFAKRTGGFGYDLGWLMEVLGQTISQLQKLTTLGELEAMATEALVKQATLVIQAENMIQSKIRSDYLRKDWKYNPEWDKAKKTLDWQYDLFKRFGVADPDGYYRYFSMAQERLKQSA